MQSEKEDLLNIKIPTLNKSDIEEECKIASGGFGDIYKGSVFKTPCAIKKLKDFSTVDFLKEIKITNKFRHPYTPRLIGISDYAPGSKELNLCIVNELINGSTLDKVIHNDKESDFEKVRMLIDLSTILSYFHAFNVIHRDLKPQNVMVNNKGEIKLLDFGISKVSNATFTQTKTGGTLAYMAPETFDIGDDISESTNMNASTSLISTKVDVWAFGLIIHELFTLDKPWSTVIRNENQLIAKLFSKVEFPVSEKKIDDKNIIGLIKNSTIVNIVNRWNINRIKKCLLENLFQRVKREEHIKTMDVKDNISKNHDLKASKHYYTNS